MTSAVCTCGADACPHLADEGGLPYCKAFARPVSDIAKCGPKLVKAALKKRKLDEKLKGKKQ